jgi:SAM-dependent methyltransferase/uncharacterized protein YbaR (Trm112 family)
MSQADRMTSMQISINTELKLLCPQTKSKLIREGNCYRSSNLREIVYPIVEGIPILIDESKSIFSIRDFTERRNTTFNLAKVGKLRSAIVNLIPDISHNPVSTNNFQQLAALLPVNAKILVIGGSIPGKGTEPIYNNPNFEIVSTDVSFGPLTQIICDAHDLPFEDASFDCVIAQAVLEHVLEPQRCVDEIYRVLKPGGATYAETPFMQQVHMRQYDFTRFTHLGHRRLFRQFAEISSGPCSGPGMALAWSFRSFLVSFAESKKMISVLTKIAHLTGFFLKYFDYYLLNKPGSYDAASGYFFMGSKSDITLSDRELIQQFKGL